MWATVVIVSRLVLLTALIINKQRNMPMKPSPTRMSGTLRERQKMKTNWSNNQGLSLDLKPFSILGDFSKIGGQRKGTYDQFNVTWTVLTSLRQLKLKLERNFYWNYFRVIACRMYKGQQLIARLGPEHNWNIYNSVPIFPCRLLGFSVTYLICRFGNWQLSLIYCLILMRTIFLGFAFPSCSTVHL